MKFLRNAYLLFLCKLNIVQCRFCLHESTHTHTNTLCSIVNIAWTRASREKSSVNFSFFFLLSSTCQQTFHSPFSFSEPNTCSSNAKYDTRKRTNKQQRKYCVCAHPLFACSTVIRPLFDIRQNEMRFINFPDFHYALCYVRAYCRQDFYITQIYHLINFIQFYLASPCGWLRFFSSCLFLVSRIHYSKSNIAVRAASQFNLTSCLILPETYRAFPMLQKHTAFCAFSALAQHHQLFSPLDVIFPFKCVDLFCSSSLHYL